MAADRPIVSRATRNAVRRLMSSLYVAAIAEYWEGENFARSEIANPRQGGVRQQTFDAYETSVDWTDKEHARRGLRVFETLLRRLARDSKKSGAQGIDPTELEDLREALEHDGYLLDGDLRVQLSSTAAVPGPQAASVPAHARHITQVTRTRLFKYLKSRDVQWFGDLDEIVFLGRLYALDELPSSDDRFDDAEGDITQHRYNNYDWEDDWVYTDARFGLNDGPDLVLLRFLSQMVHPEVRSDDAEAALLAELVDSLVRRDGYAFAPVGDISGYPIYEARRLTEDAAPHAPASQYTPRPEASAFERLVTAAWGRPGAGTGPDHTGPDGHVAASPGQDTPPGELPAPLGPYAAVLGVARGQRKDFALERLPMKVGGQAEIFEATHKVTGVRVAFKRRLSWRETPAARMRREIEVAQDLNSHPNYMPILDANPVEGWLVMPLAECTAEDRRDQLQGPSQLRELVDALLNVLEVAHDSHAGGWLHRDVKPSNILRFDGRWRLGDWGVVRRPRGQTTSDRTRAEVGTDGFAAPELLINAHDATPAADIYGVGRVIAWALTGDVPVMTQRLLPAAGPWREIVRAATARDPYRRPQTAADLRQLIQDKLAGPMLTPAERGESLLAAAHSGHPGPVETFLSFTADHPEDQTLYVGVLTQLKPETAAEGLVRLPAEAELLIEALSSHAAGHQRRIPHPEAYRAILWLQRVAAFAAAAGSWDLMDEAARAMCIWDGIWDQYRPRDVIAAWLLTLRGEAAVLMAAALGDHPGSAAHFRILLDQQALAPQIRTAIGKTARSPSQ
ncbi:protein kinase domain-containing protein [Streptomyces canus]|uniref:AbiJ-related protein n=1 Tax=Streptomyces canus TaxID=58343 RepID=UPI002E376CA5|nr:serine/threonine protein kinase [Streptomyces canus]